MRKLLLSRVLLPAAVLILTALAVQAEIVYNEIGFYTDVSGDPTTVSIFVEPNVMFDVYLVVTNPYNFEFTPPDCGEPYEREINFINGFQFRWLRPEAGMYTMAMIPNGVVGASAIFHPDYAIGLESPIPVPESRALELVKFTFMVLDTDPKLFFLQPTVFTPDDVLAIYDAEEAIDPDVSCDFGGSLQDVHPISGSFSQPVFGINTGVVSIRNASWGMVKALYR
jgi:hypothetical protein